MSGTESGSVLPTPMCRLRPNANQDEDCIIGLRFPACGPNFMVRSSTSASNVHDAHTDPTLIEHVHMSFSDTTLCERSDL